jgi:hypothetical protein
MTKIKLFAEIFLMVMFNFKELNEAEGKEEASNMKNGVFSDVTPCGSGKNRRYG